MSDHVEQWKASVKAVRRRGYISMGCERYLFLALEDPSGFCRSSDERMAAQLEIDTRMLRRWRREAKAAGLIDIGTSTWSIAHHSVGDLRANRGKEWRPMP